MSACVRDGEDQVRVLLRLLAWQRRRVDERIIPRREQQSWHANRVGIVLRAAVLVVLLPGAVSPDLARERLVKVLQGAPSAKSCETTESKNEDARADGGPRGRGRCRCGAASRRGGGV